MMNLPKDLNSLKILLVKVKDDKRQAQLRLDDFKERQLSEFYDKFVAAPAEEARAKGESKEVIEQIKLEGKEKVEAEFKKAYEKKEKEVKIKDFTKDIRKIKDEIIELEVKSVKTTNEDSSTNNQLKAQQRFEMNY